MKPFTGHYLKIEHAYKTNAERKGRFLITEKASRKQAIEDAQKLKNDHEMALLIYKTFEYDQRTRVDSLRQEQIKNQMRIDAASFLLKKNKQEYDGGAGARQINCRK